MFKPNRQRRGAPWATILLVAIVVGFAALSTIQERTGRDFGLPELRLPSFGGVLSAAMEAGGGEEPAQPALRPVGLPPADGGRVEVHFIDVGQGESILILAPEKTVLIDGGENGRGSEVVRYIQRQNVEVIDILIGTHPHADHIGGLIEVVRELEVGAVILPELPEELTPTTRTYTSLLLALLERELAVTPATPGDVFPLGGGAVLAILGPVREYGEQNNMSVVSRLTFGETAFLFTGDIEIAAESDLVAAGGVSANVLSIPHHGSRTSTSNVFLDAVAPNIAVISVGMDNRYGHPNRQTVERLQEMGVRILRTDLDGTVVLISNGESIGVLTEN